MKKVDYVRKQTLKFARMQAKYQATGAYDTEPDGVYQWILARTLESLSARSKLPKPMANPGYWQLYSDVEGADEAARVLATCALRTQDAMQAAVRQGEWDDLADFIQDYCWRVSVNVWKN